MVKAGADMVAKLLGVTLGPKGRNVVLQNKYGPPKIVNDGETVLKEVFLLTFYSHTLLMMLNEMPKHSSVFIVWCRLNWRTR